MATIDVRYSNQDEITEIVFADEYSSDGCMQGYKVTNSAIGGRMDTYFTINDPNDCVVINSKQHALDLMRAIEKAIELGWVK